MAALAKADGEAFGIAESLIDRRPPSPDPEPTTAKTNWAYQRDAVVTALEIAGIPKDQLVVGPQLEVGDAGEVASIFDSDEAETTIEDLAILQDLDSADADWTLVKRQRYPAKVFVNGDTQLTIILANKLPLERQLGVDLVYVNETFKAVVFVQYKMFGGADGEDGYRPRPVRGRGRQDAHRPKLSVLGQHVSAGSALSGSGWSAAVQPISYKRHRFPAEVIRYAVWLYFCFTLSLRDVEELLAERGIEVSYETIRCWTIKFGPLIAKNLRRRQARPTGRWHIDEMVIKIGGETRWLWRAVDDEGVVLDLLVQRRRNKKAALRLLSKLLKKTGVRPETITTDRLASYGAALRELKLSDRHRCSGRRANNRAENSHVPIRRRERKMQKFKSDGSAPRFLSTHAAVYNTFDTQPHPISRRGLRILRARAHQAWAEASAAAG